MYGFVYNQLIQTRLREQSGIRLASGADTRVFGVERLSVAERDRGQKSALRRQNGQGAFGQSKRREFVERIRRSDFVLIIDPHFFAAEAEVVMQITGDRAVEGNVGFDKRQRQIVAGHRLEYALGVGAFQIQIARGVATKIDASQDRKPWRNFLDVQRSAAADGAHFTLLNQPAGHRERRLLGEGWREI